MLRPDVDASASGSLSDIGPSTAYPLPASVAGLAGAGITGPGLPEIVAEGEPVSNDAARVLAARLLERTLLRLGRAGAIVERRLAPGLSRMHGRRLYRLLGYVRLADYLTERLGISLRRCQAILRLERALTGLPRLAEALEAGEVSVSKMEVAAGAATPDTDSLWLERAKSLPLASLREAARRASPGGAPTASTSGVAPSPTSGVAPSLRCPSPLEQDEPGRIISFPAPASVLAIWHWTLDLVRRVAGQQEPAWRCAEFLAAEFLSGVPDSSGEDPSRPSVQAPGSPATPCVRPSKAFVPAASPKVCSPKPATDERPGMVAWMEASAAVREALSSIGVSADPETILSERASAGGREALTMPNRDDEIDAWELDADLRRLVRLRQSLAWRQGRLLATFASLRLHGELGFHTFDGWVGERLAMSPRRARYLVSLERRLRDLPLVADAYRRGLVSWCHARLLVRIVRPATQARWIRYARQVTVRRLDDVIVWCEVAAAESSAISAPTAAAHIGALSLPPAEPLPPSEPPPLETACPSPAFEPALADGPARHTSAPLLDLTAAPGARSHRPARGRISFWCPLDVASLWSRAMRSCRAATGTRLEDWECFLLFVRSLRETWETQEEPHWRRRYRIFERDGWRCKAPGCTSRSGLNEHHITFRSRQGGNDAENLVTLCVGHHQQGLHEGRIRCFGTAPDGLWWDLGVKPGGEPLARYFGDRMVKRRPFFSVAPVPRDVAPDPPADSAAAGAG